MDYTFKIRKKPQMWWLIWLLIMLPFLFALMNELLGLPWAVRYILDCAWVVLLGAILLSRQRGSKGLRNQILWIGVFLVYTLVGYGLRYKSALYYLWGFRNNFRMYAAFLAFSFFLTREDAGEFLKIFDGIFWLNAVASVFQYVVLGLSGDYLGGIFGATAGGNGYTNVFFCIVMIKSIICYLEKKETTAACVVKFVTAMLVAALAELKFFFIEAIMIIALAVLVSNFTWRKVLIIVGGIVAVVAGISLLSVIFPSYAGWFSVENILKSATTDKGYTYSGDLNRLNAIPRINAMWLRDPAERLFGLGLGNCDTSSIELLNTPFYRQYGKLHYTWLSYAHMYLECGWIGLLLYMGFFALVFFRARRIGRGDRGVRGTYARIAMLMAILCVLISVYNSSLRTEAGYMAYFVLSLPFLKDGNSRSNPVYISKV